MNRIQARTRISAGMSRLLLVPLATLAIIAGLLAMHTFTGAESASVQAATSARVHEQIPAADGSPASASMAGTYEVHPAFCVGSCESPMGMPDHSVLMMICVLALLTAVITLLAPPLISLFASVFLPPWKRGRTVLFALPHPRPPSLVVLSISRT